MIDLDIKYINFIKKDISKYLSNFEIYLFGSRAKGTARKYSDIDIAILSDELTSDIKLKLEANFENSTLPYKIDIIDLKTISHEFKDLIKDSLIKI
mgnify:CR=1 FL=1